MHEGRKPFKFQIWIYIIFPSGQHQLTVSVCWATSKAPLTYCSSTQWLVSTVLTESKFHRSPNVALPPFEWTAAAGGGQPGQHESGSKLDYFEWQKTFVFARRKLGFVRSGRTLKSSCNKMIKVFSALVRYGNHIWPGLASHFLSSCSPKLTRTKFLHIWLRLTSFFSQFWAKTTPNYNSEPVVEFWWNITDRNNASSTWPTNSVRHDEVWFWFGFVVSQIQIYFLVSSRWMCKVLN